MGSGDIIILFFPTSPYYLLCPLVSFISALAVIVLSMLTGYYKEPLRKIGVIILFFDCIYCLQILIAGYPYPKSDTLCSIFGFVAHFSFEVVWVYSALFANAVFTVIKELDQVKIKEKMWWYFFWGIVVPFLHSVGLVFTNYVQYYPDDNQCAHIITPGKFDTSYFFGTSMPVAVCCMLSLIWYALAARQLRTILTETRKRDFMVLLLYPAIMIACWGPNLILNAVINFGGSPSYLWVDLFFQGVCKLQGFFNAIVYGCTGKFLLEIRKLKCCRWLCNNTNDQLYSSNIKNTLQAPHDERRNTDFELSRQISQSLK